MPFRPCLICGEPTRAGSYCDQHRRPDSNAPRHARGYDRQWELLSERARRQQPFCLVCGTSDDLTCDHTPEAWRRKAAGKPIRLQDVRVLCRSCNSKAGRARPTTRGDTPTSGASEPPRKAGRSLHTPWSGR